MAEIIRGTAPMTTMRHHPIPQLWTNRRRAAWPYLTVILAVFAVASALPKAQGGPPSGARPSAVQLQRGRPFRGDLRQLPNSLPEQRETRHERERDEPLLPTTGSHDDRVAQTAAPALPAPAPGSGGGAGDVAGLDFANWGDGWPPDTNGDVGPIYYIQAVNTSIGIFRKSDGARVAAMSFNTLMSQGNFGNACDTHNFGDPVVVWDPGADRWIISDFAFVLDASGNAIAPYFQCFAVSQTSDPVG